MAKDGDLNFDLSLDAGQAVQQANELAKALAGAAAKAEAVVKQMAALGKGASDANSEAAKLLKTLTEQAKARQLAKAVIQSRPSGDPKRAAAGRTVGDDEVLDYAVKALSKGFDLAGDQVQRRLREAATKAAERMIKTTEEALNARLSNANLSTYKTRLNATQEAQRADALSALLKRERKNQQFAFSSPEEFYRAEEARRKAELDSRSAASQARLAASEVAAKERRQARIAELKKPEGQATLLRERTGRFIDYAALGTGLYAVTNLSKAIIDLDDAMARFQAITQTSNSEITDFKKNLMELASQSRYSTKDIAEAAITLGQTGLSGRGVSSALRPVLSLATASGSTVAQAVEVTTAAMGAYNMEASRAGEVANILTAALNQTKLTMTQLGQGIQYAANVARESDISFSELSSILGGLAQAGIRSGSTLGTGTRQLIQELTSPSDKLKNVLKQLNIELSEIDIRANGFTGVLENLRSKGFGTAEALRSLDLRAASAFSAIAGQADTIKRLQETLLLTDAAAEGAETASKSLSAAFQRFGNTVLTITDSALKPFVDILKLIVDYGTKALQIFGGNTTFNQIAAFFASVGVGALAITKLTSGLAILVSLSPALAGIGATLGAISLPITALVLTGGGLATLFGMWAFSSDSLAEKLDRVKGSLNQLTEQESQTRQALSTLDRMVDSLILRREKLNSDPIMRRTAIIEAQKAFAEWGIQVDTSSTSIDGLIGALQRLQATMQKDLTSNLKQQLLDLNAQMDLLRQKVGTDSESALGRLYSALGGGTVDRFIRGGTKSGDSQAILRLAQSAGIKGDIQSIVDFIGADIDSIDPRQANSLAAPLRKTLGENQDAMRKRRGELIRLSGERSLKGYEKSELDKLEKALAIIQSFSEEITQTVSRFSNIEALRTKTESTKLQEQAGEIRSSRTFQGFDTRRDTLFTQLAGEGQEIMTNSTLDARQKLAKLEELKEKMKTGTAEMTVEMDEMVRSLKAQGFSDEAIKAALSDLRDQMAQLGKLIAQGFDVKKTAIELEKIVIAAQRRGLEAERQRQLTIARQALDKAVVDAAARRIDAITEEIGNIDKRRSRLDAGLPDKITDSQREIEDEIDARSKQQRLEYEERMAEVQKRRLDQALEAEETMLRKQKEEIDKQIAALQKELSNPRTTEERARELVKSIVALIERAKQIIDGIGDVQLRRDLEKTPEGYSFSPGDVSKNAVAQQIVTSLKAMGRDSLSGIALAFAAKESRFNPNAQNDSGATGLFQFMKNSTWKQYGKGNIFDVQAQIEAFVAYIDVLSKVFSAKKGRGGTPQELYTLWQQGPGGGMALMNADPNSRAIDALRPFYQGRRGRYLRGAISGNAPGKDPDTLTVGEFLQIIQGGLGKAATGTGGMIKSSKEVVAEGVRAGTEAAKKVEEEKGKTAGNTLANKIWERMRSQATREEREAMSDIASKRRGLSKTFDDAGADSAMRGITDKWAEMFQKALKKMEESPEWEGMSDAQRKDAKEALRGRFREQAERDAISGASQVGKNILVREQAELNRLKKEQELIEKNQTLYTQGEVDKNRAALEAQQVKVDNIEKEVSLKRELKAINDQIAQITASGLGTEKELTELLARKQALEQGVAEAKKTSAAAAEQEKRAAQGGTIGNALSAGADKFFVSIGQKNATGKWKTMTEEMSDMWNQALSSMDSAMSNLFVNLASGTMKAKDAFKQFAMSVIQDMLKIVSQALSRQILRALFGGEGGLFGGGGDAGGGIGGIFSTIFGGLGKLFGSYNGGMPRYAMGGAVPTRDSMMVLAQPGEMFLRKTAVDALGKRTVEELNNLGPNKVSKPGPKKPDAKGKSDMVNVWVVSPEQVPPPGPKDIIATVTTDIMNRGPIRQLVKQVAIGAA